MNDTTKKLPRINYRLKTFGSCEEDYVIHGMKIANIHRRHGVKKPTLEQWRKNYKWDEQREGYLLIRGRHIKIVSNVAERAEKSDADPKDIQLYKDLYRQLIDTDPNMRPIPNKERLVIVKMTLEYLRKGHTATVDRFIAGQHYDQLVEAVVSF